MKKSHFYYLKLPLLNRTFLGRLYVRAKVCILEMGRSEEEDREDQLEPTRKLAGQWRTKGKNSTGNS